VFVLSFLHLSGFYPNAQAAALCSRLCCLGGKDMVLLRLVFYRCSEGTRGKKGENTKDTLPLNLNGGFRCWPLSESIFRINQGVLPWSEGSCKMKT
jgi:hypothetical protein